MEERLNIKFGEHWIAEASIVPEQNDEVVWLILLCITFWMLDEKHDRV